jgi:hypothetical protein
MIIRQRGTLEADERSNSTGIKDYSEMAVPFLLNQREFQASSKEVSRTWIG